MSPAAAAVALLHYQTYPEVRTAKFARTLADAGYRVTVLARQTVAADDPRGKHPYPVDAAGGAGPGQVAVRAVAAPDAGRLALATSMPYHVNPLWRRAIRALLDEGTDLLIVHDLHLVLAATALARPRGVPVLFDMSENYPALLEVWRGTEGRRRAVVNGVLRNVRAAKRVEQLAARAADAITVVVPEHVDRVARLRGRRDDIAVVDNTPVLADLDHRPASGPAPDPTESDTPRLHVVYTGEIHYYRGIDTVLDTAALLAGAPGQPLQFTLVGTGRAFDRLRQRATDLGLGGTIRFTGWQPDLRPYLETADIGLVPPHASAHYEVTMPNKVYDFMAFGKPVVVSDTAPMRRVVVGADAGCTFRPGDPADLARVLRGLTDPGLRGRLGRNGRSAVERIHHWGRDGATLLATVERLLRGRAGGGGG